MPVIMLADSVGVVCVAPVPPPPQPVKPNIMITDNPITTLITFDLISYLLLD
jgi:hypothetical protein